MIKKLSYSPKPVRGEDTIYSTQELHNKINEIVDVLNKLSNTPTYEAHIISQPTLVCTCHLNITPCCPLHNERMH